MHFNRRDIVQTLVGAFVIVELEILCQPLLQSVYRGIVVQMHVFLLDRVPEALDKHVVQSQE